MRGTLAFPMTLTLSCLVTPCGAAAPATRGRIAFLELSAAPPASALTPVVAAFQHGLCEFGWVEGRNLTIEWRWAEGSLERFATLADEVVRLKVDLIVVPNQTAAQVGQQATTTMPIIIAAGGALAQEVTNLAQPGGNVTGLAGLGPELSSKRLELLTHVVPRLTCVAVLRGLSPQTREVQALAVAARGLGVQLQLLQARDPTEIDQAFAEAVRAGAGALVVFADGGTFHPHRVQLAELALQHRLPSILNGQAFSVL